MKRVIQLIYIMLVGTDVGVRSCSPRIGGNWRKLTCSTWWSRGHIKCLRRVSNYKFDV